MPACHYFYRYFMVIAVSKFHIVEVNLYEMANSENQLPFPGGKSGKSVNQVSISLLLHKNLLHQNIAVPVFVIQVL